MFVLVIKNLNVRKLIGYETLSNHLTSRQNITQRCAGRTALDTGSTVIMIMQVCRAELGGVLFALFPCATIWFTDTSPCLL